MRAHKDRNANLVMQLAPSAASSAVRTSDSVVLGQRRQQAGTPSASSVGVSTPSTPRGGVCGGSSVGSGSSGGGGDGSTGLVEMRACEIASTVMVDVVGCARVQGGGSVNVGLHRYTFHIASLVQVCALRVR
eukprot:359588-Chlamydomonas_euryale.AAC.2